MSVGWEERERMRILELPVLGPLAPEEVEEASRMALRASVFAQGERLLEPQASMYLTLLESPHGGAFAPVPVGYGKSGCALLAAKVAIEQGASRVMIVVPASALFQFRQIDVPMWRRMAQLPYQVRDVSSPGPRARDAMYRVAAPGVYLCSYHSLSRKDSTDMLEALHPQMLIFDEAHHVAQSSAVRSSRVFARDGFLAQAEEKMRPCRVIAMSATISDKRLGDYQHLMAAALGESSPMPLSKTVLYNWGASLDAASDGIGQAGPALLSLPGWARTTLGINVESGQMGLRRAYKLRMVTAPGVITMPQQTLKTSVELDLDRVPMPADDPGIQQVLEMATQVEAGQTPSGDEIDSEMHKWRYLRDLAAGHYHLLYWPEDAPKDTLDRSKAHLDIVQEYHRELRAYLNDHAILRLDTPALVGAYFARTKGPGVLPEHLWPLWEAAKAAEFPGMLQRNSRFVRVSSYKVDAAVRWAQALLKQHKGVCPGALIWYENIGTGIWLKEALDKAGLPTLHCPAGKASNEAIASPQARTRFVLASIPAHGQSKQLHDFQHNYIVQPPRQAKTMEQMLGRTHRTRQTADSLLYPLCVGPSFDDEVLAACLVDSLYQHFTLGDPRKVIYGTWRTAPVLYPPEFLHARGLECRVLDERERRALRARFQPDP